MGSPGSCAPPPRDRAADSLLDLPNIGKETASLLTAAGIVTPNDLRRAGAVEAALAIARLRPADPPCRSMLSGLEGAIRGVRWHSVPKHEREKLWEAYRLRIVQTQMWETVD